MATIKAETPSVDTSNESSEKVEGIFSYSDKITSRQETGANEIQVTISFVFGKKEPYTYRGSEETSFEKEGYDKEKALSFLTAAQKAWSEFQKRDSKYHSFVKHSLRGKWKELNGEKLTGEKLVFNNFH